MSYKYKTIPYCHQEEITKNSFNLGYAALFLEMGTGKTKITIDSAGQLYNLDRIDCMCVVSLNGLYTNWNDEISLHLPDNIPRKVACWKQSTGKKWLRDFNNILHGKELRIFLINIEAVNTIRGYDAIDDFITSGRCFFVVDESTIIKNPKAKCTKAMLKLAKKVLYRRILSGTPVLNSPLDLFTQCEFLYPGVLGFKHFFLFKAHYGVLREIQLKNTRRIVKIVVGYRHLEQLKQSIKPFSYILKKNDCLDLPEKIYSKYYYELTPEQKRLYIEMAKNAVAELSGEICSAAMVLTKLIRLSQLVNGRFVSDSGKSKEIPCKKLNALMDIYETMTRPVVIWANFRADIQSIYKKLSESGEKCAMYYGDTKEADRQLIVHDFQAGQYDAFIANPSTAGYGLTLTRSNQCIYYTNSYSYGERIQSEDRLHRIGQKRTVSYMDLIAKNTIEERILKVLENKKNVSEVILSDGLESVLSL